MTISEEGNMAHWDLWKYCTAEQTADFLLSLQLLGTTGWPPQKELACLYAVSNHVDRHYRKTTIPKGDGSARILHVPDPLLGRIQTNILHHILDGMAVSPSARAYFKGASIRANAAPHAGKPLLLKLDIQDFFGSITFPMVYHRAFPTVCFPPAAGTMLTHLCCYRECLPQGAPTSAAISNLVMRPFDDYMARWCGERHISYTRYCDDMAFSGDFDARQVERKVDHYLEAMGFSLNRGKTRLLRQHQRQTVTGVVVNQKLQVSRSYRRKLRQEIHYCRQYGAASHLERLGDSRPVADYLLSLLGRIQFVLQINPADASFREAKAAVEGLYRRQIDTEPHRQWNDQMGSPAQGCPVEQSTGVGSTCEGEVSEENPRS